LYICSQKQSRMNYKAVITGDIINSRKIADKELLMSVLQNLFIEINTRFSFQNQFEIYRGDSFQTLLENPKQALRIALLLRLGLRKQSPDAVIWDARIGVGIGAVNYLNEDIKISNGEAFELSGTSLDTMKKSDQRIQIQVSDSDLNAQLKILNTLADAIVNRWSINASEVIYRQLLFGETQSQIAQKLNISQSAVHQRFANANFDAINTYISYFEQHIIADK